MARQRSSARPVTREYLTPASGWNSNVVTMGPGLIWVTWPLTPNSAHFCDQGAGLGAQGLFADDGDLVGAVEERGGRELVAADGLGRDGDLLEVGVGAAAEGDGVRLGEPGQVQSPNPTHAMRLHGWGTRLGGGRLRMARGGSSGELQSRRAASSAERALSGAAAAASSAAKGAAAAAAVLSAVAGGAST